MDNNIDILNKTLEELVSINDVISKFNNVMDELNIRLNEVIKTSEKEDVIFIAEKTNENLKLMNDRYKEFLETNNITEVLDNKIESINKLIDSINLDTTGINKEIKSVKTKITKISKNNDVLLNSVDNLLKNNSDETVEKIKDLVNISMEEVISNQLLTLKQDLINSIGKRIDNSVIKYEKSENKILAGKAFIKDDYLYYISEINGGRIQRYNFKTYKEEDFISIYNKSNNNHFFVKINLTSCIKINYIKDSSGEEYLYGIHKKERILFSLNLNTGKLIELSKYCIDYIKLGEFIYCLSHNIAIEISIKNGKIRRFIKLIDGNIKITENKGSIDILDDKIFVNFNKYNFIIDKNDWKLINLF